MPHILNATFKGQRPASYGDLKGFSPLMDVEASLVMQLGLFEQYCVPLSEGVKFDWLSSIRGDV